MGALRSLTVTSRSGCSSSPVRAALARHHRRLQPHVREGTPERHVALERFRTELQAGVGHRGAVLGRLGVGRGRLDAAVRRGLVSRPARVRHADATRGAATTAACCWRSSSCCRCSTCSSARASSTCSRCSSRSTCSSRSRCVSALANDPQRFLERTAKIQWGITVCGLRHEPCAGPAAARPAELRRPRRVPRAVPGARWCERAHRAAARRAGACGGARSRARSAAAFSWRSWLVGRRRRRRRRPAAVLGHAVQAAAGDRDGHDRGRHRPRWASS